MSTGKLSSAAAQEKAALESAIEKVNRQLKELRSFDVTGIKDRWDTRLEGLQKRINATLSSALGGSSPEYKKFTIRALDESIDTTFGDRYTGEELAQGIKTGIGKATANLN